MGAGTGVVAATGKEKKQTHCNGLLLPPHPVAV